MRQSSSLVLFTIALCSVTLAIPAQAQTAQQAKESRGGAEQLIDHLTQQMVQAQRNNDPTAYEQHYADNAVIIHAAGQVLTKSEEIASLKSGATKYESVEVRDEKIQVYGDTAAVELLASVKGKLKGNPFDAEFRVTRLWVKSNGEWKIVLFQTTRVAPLAH